jgi:hypothetical protein
MSLFTVLKYPISWPPTKEELEALPKEVLDRWVEHNVWNVACSATISNMMQVLYLQESYQKSVSEYLAKLTLILLDYNEEHEE